MFAFMKVNPEKIKGAKERKGKKSKKVVAHRMGKPTGSLTFTFVYPRRDITAGPLYGPAFLLQLDR